MVDNDMIKTKKIYQLSLSLNKIADTKITVAQIIAFMIINFFVLV